MGHHWVPQYYLRGFSDREKRDFIWLYDKDGGFPRRLPIKGVAQAKKYFTAEVEAVLAKEVEGRANPVLDKIRHRKSISDRERLLLSVYMQVMILRVPAREKIIARVTPTALENAFGRVDRVLTVAAARDLSRAPMLEARREEARRLRAQCEKELPKDLLEQIRQPEIRPRLVEAICAMKWFASVAEEGSAFLTNDNPLFFDHGLGLKESDFFFPVSTKVALCGTHIEDCVDGYFPATHQDVSLMNQLTIAGATRYVFHSRGDLPWPRSDPSSTTPRLPDGLAAQ